MMIEEEMGNNATGFKSIRDAMGFGGCMFFVFVSCRCFF